MLKSNPFSIKTPTNADIKNNHCKGFIRSFKMNKAKIAANIGATYRMETAVPAGNNFKDEKNKVIAINPQALLNNKSFTLLPTIEMLCLIRNGYVKKSDPKALKHTI
ncbi:hypothetical protein GCM10009431_11500 [Gaetbulibacter jejuensis]|uniref:Uncharacterized protein n=1 Tax=Gaetbulibacter jejuensis TaxID=584607 RepID=A0ABN1JKE1_9FLAO